MNNSGIEMSPATNEVRFLNELESLFVGAEVEGDSGFVNLMRLKHCYFQTIRNSLMEKIEVRTRDKQAFREELFDKLYTFFKRHFCESGSIYFRYLPAFSKIYERVYERDRDVELSWKTQMLYYVKSDLLVRSIPVKLDDCDFSFFFDATSFQGKRFNEKRSLVFTFNRVERSQSMKHAAVVHIDVSYSEKGKKTKYDEILKQAHAQNVPLSEPHLQKSICVFYRQSEIDFFISKDAGEFLREQFDMWMYQYIYSEETTFEQTRIKQLQAIKETAYDVIEFLAQFEDELRRVWEKPKFVRNVNYVITSDRLSSISLQKLSRHKGMSEQWKEWLELGIVSHDILNSLETQSKDEQIPPECDDLAQILRDRILPLDTRYFKDLQYEILDDVGNLDEALDGELVRSDNWQALNTLSKRYFARAQCLYLDPPFNTGKDFEYRDKFQDSSWLTLMENRIDLAKKFLSGSGHVYLQLDHYADYLGRFLLQRAFPNVGKEDQTVITWNTGENISGFKTQRKNWIRQADKILTFPKHPSSAKFVKLWNPLDKHKDDKIGWLDFIGDKVDNKLELYVEKWHENQLIRESVNIPAKRIGTVWNDIFSFQYSEPRETESFSFKTQKPENLLRRIIQSSTNQGDLVVDLFAGLGTTPAVAHKLGRKWLAIESGSHFDETYIDSNNEKKVGLLGRLKIVVSGDKSFTLPNSLETRKPHLSKDLNWNGGGLFKYYSLEQYEDALKSSQYHEGDQLELDSTKTPFEQYVFFGDDKLSHVVVPNRKGGISINLQDLYSDIDIPETLSNMLGKTIRKLTSNSMTFEDGTSFSTDPQLMSIEEQRRFIDVIKPLLWWG